MFLYVQRFFDWLLAFLGYYPINQEKFDIIQNLGINLQHQREEINGLVAGFGSLEQRHQTHVLLILALMTCMGEEEKILKWDFLKAIYEKNLDIYTEHLDTNDILVRVVLANTEGHQCEHS